MPYRRHLYLLLPIASMLSALSLDETVMRGLENSHRLASAHLQVVLADENTKEKAAKHFGAIEAVANYAHYNTPRTLYPLTPAAMASGAAKIATTQDLFSAGLRYHAALFSGFAMQDDADIAGIREKIASLQYGLEREALIYAIRSAYVDALAARAGTAAWQAYTGALQALYKSTEKEVSLGKKAPVELLKVDAERLKSETISEEFNTQTRSLTSLLTVLTGGSGPVEPLEEIDEFPLTAAFDVAEHSSKVSIADLEVERAAKDEHKSHADSLPQIGIEGYYGYSYGPNDATNPNSGTWEHQELWSAGLNVQWTLSDFGASSARRQQSRILKMKQEQAEAETLLQTGHERHDAARRFETAQRRYRLTEKEYALAQKTEEIETIRYREGEIGMNDFLQQKAKSQLARSEMIASRYAMLKAYYTLEYLYEQGDPQ